MSQPVKYVAQLSNVREATLFGEADLGFWQRQLRDERLEPVPGVEGRAQVMIIGADSRFQGVRFREIGISVVVRTVDAAPALQGAWLAQAFNSVRFFAWVERAVFKTPYAHAGVLVNVQSPTTLEITLRKRLLFSARASSTSAPKETLPPVNDGWSGPVFLPGLGDKTFIAKIDGLTRKLPFCEERHLLEIRPEPPAVALRWLLESNFKPREWRLRESARHAKSKTYRRDQLRSLELAGLATGAG